MNDRGMKKWRPFSAVVPNEILLKTNNNIALPSLSEDDIQEFESALKVSFYTHSKVTVTYIENGQVRNLVDFVLNIDPINKDIFFQEKRINFRQIVNVKKD